MPDLLGWGRRELSKLEQDMDRLFHELYFDLGLNPALPAGIAVRDEGDRLVIVTCAEGFSAEEIALTVEEDRLVIAAARRERNATGEHLRTLRRSARLPARVRADKAQAVLNEGLLEIVVPKLRPPASRTPRVQE